ncbi:MAG: helix-turn-helix transcriptional regulator [Bacilli bacterium]|nr:helix-turn-helix transcriptional regulator [Bacilli bacterium]
MILKNFRESREDMDLTQRDVSKLLHLHSSTISGWETGKDTIPIEHLIKYANEFSLSLDYLFGLIPRNEKYYPVELDLVQLAHNLTELRLQNHFTQNEVAKKLNTSQAAYSHYENSINIIPTNFIYGLTKIYSNFSIDEMFGRKKIV